MRPLGAVVSHPTVKPAIPTAASTTVKPLSGPVSPQPKTSTPAPLTRVSQPAEKTVQPKPDFQANAKKEKHVSIEEQFGRSDPYYDEAAKLLARMLVLEHGVACLQHQRGEPETEARIPLTQSLYQYAHDQAARVRACSIQQQKKLSVCPPIDWSLRLDSVTEAKILTVLARKIDLLRKKIHTLKKE